MTWHLDTVAAAKEVRYHTGKRPGGSVHRRELFRRPLLGVAGAVSVASPRAEEREFPADYASRDLTLADWKQVFLDDRQSETFIILSDLIIPKACTG